MSDRSYAIYFDDIISAMEHIERYIKDIDFPSFKSNQMIIDAVVRNLEIIGEASKNIPPDIRNSAPEIEWRKMAGLRDRMIHDYMNVDLNIIWDIITLNLPETKPKLVARRNKIS